MSRLSPQQEGPSTAQGVRGVDRVRYRILLLAAALAVLFVGATAIARSYEKYTEYEESRVQAHKSATAVAAELASILQSLDASLGVLATHVSHLPLRRENIEPILHNEIVNYSHARVLIVTDAQGAVIADTWGREETLGHDASKWPYVSIHQQGPERGLYVSPPLESCIDGRVSLPLSHAIRSEDGELRGIIVLSLEPEAFARSLRASVAGHGALRSSLLYEDGRVMAASDPETEPPGTVDVDLEAARKVSGFAENGSLFIDEATARTADTVPSFFGWAPVGGYPLRAAFTLDAAKEFAPVARMTRLMLVLAAIYITGVGLALWWLYYQAVALAKQTGILEEMAADLEESNASLQQEVAERRQAEGLLREREAEFRTFFETGVIGTGEVGADRRLRRVNQRLCETTGWPREELIGKDLADITVPGDLPQNQAVFEELISGERDEALVETRCLAKDGSEVPVLVGTRVLRDAESGRCRFILHVLDISERVAAERALRASELRYRTIAQNLPNAAVFVYDQELRYELAAGMVLEHAGVDPSEVQGHTVAECWPREVTEIAVPANRAALEGKSSQYHVVFKDHIYENHCFPLLDDAGNILAGAAIVYDITDRIRREEERARFMQLSLGLMLVADFDGIVRQVNPGWRMLLGYEEEELTGRPFLDLVHPDDQEATAAETAAIAEGKRTMRFVNRYRTKGGDCRTFEWAAVPVHEEKSIYAIAHDITELENTTTALLERESTLRTLLQTAPIGIATATNRVVGWINEAFSAITGYAPDEIKGRNIRFLYPNDDEYERVGRDLYSALSKNGKAFVETRFQRKDGEVRDILLNASPQLPGETHDTIIFTIMDITERKQGEAELKRLAAAIEQAEETILLMDADQIVVYANAALERHSGYSVAEVLGRNPGFLYEPKVNVAESEALQQALDEGHSCTAEFVARRKDGTTYLEETTVSPVRDAEGTIVGYASTQRDVSRERELESQLRQMQKMEAVGQLAGGVAHDFNNLLQVIEGYTDIVLQSLPAESEIRDDLGEVIHAAHRASDLVRQLLTFSRRQPMQPKVVDINDLLSNLLKMLRRVLGEHIELVVRSSSGLWPVLADAGQLEQIIMNLCVNARDAMPDGGPITLSTANVRFDDDYCASHPWAREGQFVLVSVADMGTGIPPKVRERIFEPFFTTKAVGEGTGLGLATVYAIVQRHDGLMRLYSEVGLGTTFRIYLPATATEEQTEEAEAISEVRGGTETLLLAEDDAQVRAMAQRVLERAGYSVLTARDGAEAISLFDSGPPVEAAVLDIVMPKYNGQAVAAHIQKVRPELPILFCSGHTFSLVDPGKADDLDAEFLQKPYSPTQLLTKVRECLDAAKDAGA